MTTLDKSAEWAITQATRRKSLDAIAAWNLLLSPLESILQAARLYTEGGYSLGAAAKAAGVRKLALMAALHLRVDSGLLSEADRSAIARAHAQAQCELTDGTPPRTETDQVTEEELQSVMALVREALSLEDRRPTRAEFLDAVRRRVTT